MAKAQNKTQKTELSVREFLDSVEPAQRREDSLMLLSLMEELTGMEAKMWGASIVGFGDYHYQYESGREGDFFKVGFSPRKQNLTLYIMPGFDRYEDLMAKLGIFKTGKSCLYLKKLEDVNAEVLRELIVESVRYMNEKYG
ncbi:MAG: DUF1801 domain-containing protein [Bacteroidia bacterium]|nr:DUF1801 domain-containing protein [Bacteroidia bacterium]